MPFHKWEIVDSQPAIGAALLPDKPKPVLTSLPWLELAAEALKVAWKLIWSWTYSDYTTAASLARRWTDAALALRVARALFSRPASSVR